MKDLLLLYLCSDHDGVPTLHILEYEGPTTTVPVYLCSDHDGVPTLHILEHEGPTTNVPVQ